MALNVASHDVSLMGVFAGLNLFERFACFPLREGALFGRPMCFRFLKGDLLAAVAEIGEDDERPRHR